MKGKESNRGQRLKFLLLYTVIFIPMSWIVFQYFWNGNRTFLWLPDGWRQHYKGLLYYSKWLREVFRTLFAEHSLQLPSFSFSIGYGSDVLTTLHYYVIGDPLTLFCAFVPEAHMLTFYEIMVVVRIYLAGIAFAHYCFYRKKTNCHAVLAGAFVYIFCAYVLFAGVRHPYFVNPMIYLPLVLTGVERLWRERKPGLFVGSVFLSVVSNFYFFYMIVIFTVLYVVFRLFCIYHKKEWRKMLLEVAKLAGYAVVGVMLGAFMLLPILKCFVGNPRLGTGYVYEKLYSKDYYGTLLPSLVTYAAYGSWTKLGYAAIAVPSIASLFVGIIGRKWKEKGALKNETVSVDAVADLGAGGVGAPGISRTALGAAFLLLTLFFLFPSAGYAMNGFAYVSNRWGWGYNLLIAFLVVVEWEELLHGTWKRLLFVGGITVLYGVAGFLLSRKLATELLPNFVTALVVLLLTLLCMVAAAWLQARQRGAQKAGMEEGQPGAQETGLGEGQPGAQETGLEEGQPGAQGEAAPSGRRVPWIKLHKNALGLMLVQTFLLLLVLANVGATAYYAYSKKQGDYASEFKRQSRFWKDFVKSESDAIMAASADETEFFRYTGRDLIPNVSLQSGLHNTQFYWSLGNGVVTEYFMEQDLLQGSAFNYMGLDDRTFACALAAVKYHVTGAGEDGYAPYGYEKVALPEPFGENYNVYRNPSALPLGYTYKKYILYEDYMELPVLARQEAMLQGVVVKEPVMGLEAAEPVWTGYEPELKENYNSKKTVKTEEGFETNQKNATVTYTFDGMPNCETYLVISGLYYDWGQNPQWRDQDQAMDMKVLAKDEAGETLVKTFKYLGVSQDHYNGQHDFAINLGYSEGRRVSVSITFPRSGKYRVDEVKVVCQPMEFYEEALKELGSETLADVDLHDDNPVAGTNRITGSITLSEPKLLVLAIPYSEGWSAWVDGTKQEVLQANTMFCALALPAGEHGITLRYRTPGLLAGMAVSALGLLVWCGCLVLPAIKRKRQGKAMASGNAAGEAFNVGEKEC